jgi:hypothetical protein
MIKKYLIGIAAIAIIAIGVVSLKPFTKTANLGAAAVGGGGTGEASTVTINVPNGYESYTAGQKITVSWETSNLSIDAAPTYYIVLMGYVNGVEKYSTLLSQFTGTPSQNVAVVTLPSTISGVPYGDNFKLNIIENNQGQTAQATSANYFSILAPTVVTTGGNSTACTATSAPSITVVSPNGGQSYTAGQSVTVTWTSCNVPASTPIFLTLQGDTTVNAALGITDASAGNDKLNTGSYTFTLPTQTSWKYLVYGNHYTMRVGSDNPSILAAGVSANTFSINGPAVATGCTATSAPSMTLTSPNGGETYTAGQSLTVTWTSCNVPASNPTFITLQGDATVNAAIGITQTITNSGSYTFTIPTQSSWKYLVYGDHYTIRVGSFSSIVAEGISANPFTINAGATVGTIGVSANGSTTARYVAPGGLQVHGTVNMNIPFSVTAVSGNVYIPAVTKLVTSGSISSPTITAGPYIQYTVDNGSTLQSPVTSGVITYTGSDTISPDANGNYLIPAGQTKNFALNITYSPTTAGSYRGRLANLNWNGTDSATAYNAFTGFATPNQFATPYVAVH